MSMGPDGFSFSADLDEWHGRGKDKDRVPIPLGHSGLLQFIFMDAFMEYPLNLESYGRGADRD